MYTESQSIPRRRDAAAEASFDCAKQVFGGFEQVARLNMQTVKTSLAEQQTLMAATLSAGSISEAIDLQSKQFPASITKIFAYWRHVRDIAVQTQSNLFSAAHESIGCAWPTFFAEEAARASSESIDPTRSDAARLFVTAPAPTASPVVILNSDGDVVSPTDARSVRN